MRWIYRVFVTALMALVGVFVVGCSVSQEGDSTAAVTDIVTDTSFMADIVANVAGDRLTVSSLIPEGADPHSFEPTPKDVRRLAESRVVVINVAGLVPTIDELIDGVADETTQVIVASAGLPDLEQDPHCWLDPVLVLQYVENIAAGLAQSDPEGKDVFEENAASYSTELQRLDAWIREQVATIPPANRLLVTDHESLGRFAERYGFTVVGAIFPTTSGDGSPSARALTELVTTIQESGAPAIFLEAGGNSDLARQVGEETGAKVVTDLYAHSLGPGAATYVDMMRWNVTKIVEALQ